MPVPLGRSVFRRVSQVFAVEQSVTELKKIPLALGRPPGIPRNKIDKDEIVRLDNGGEWVSVLLKDGQSGRAPHRAGTGTIEK
jgi:hypothetical protein